MGGVGRGGRAIAGPFGAEDFRTFIPADKKLDPAWLKALPLRGEAEVYSGAELATIGMPIGGIGAGQVYLGGDGRLWHWDILNLPVAGNFTSSAGPNYAEPPKPASPFDQGFGIRVGDGPMRRLDATGFRAEQIRFRGEYPMGRVTYDDPMLPVRVELEAFSPFIPLDAEESSYPAIVMSYRVTNRSAEALKVGLGGWLENPVSLGSGQPGMGDRRNLGERLEGLTILHATARATPPRADAPAPRPDRVLDDFEADTYEGWTVAGEAFGKGPARGTMPGQQVVSGHSGQGLVNSFGATGGDDVTGQLTSKPFTIDRRHIAFLIGGGDDAKTTCVRLMVDGAIARSARGRDSERLEWTSWDVTELEGKSGTIEIIDAAKGPWGHVNVDQITLTDRPPAMRVKVEEQDDFGSMALALLGSDGSDTVHARLAGIDRLFGGGPGEVEAVEPFGQPLVGGVVSERTIGAGETAEITFVVAWWFPGLPRKDIGPIGEIESLKRSYARRFDGAGAVAQEVSKRLAELRGATREWVATWYDSTLPYWFLDRTFIPICTLATSTAYRFDTGRFYAFEGVRCCQGTCQHVWNYAQSVGRIFPELERDLRVRTDFGTAWHEDGATDYRGECARHVAHDGQCGVILRAYREHLTAPDAAYLQATWPRIKRSIEYLMGCDQDDDGILEGPQYNTLDAAWYGPMAWISSLYLGAIEAGQAMAEEMNDAEFAKRCKTIAEVGRERLMKVLYDGEYFYHRPDPAHPEGTNSNEGCHIDQLMGQAWAWQVGLPRITPVDATRSALEAIWKYNFTPDAGGYMKAMQPYIKGGRWYAMPGEGGVVMTTFPRGDAVKSNGKGGFAFYFSEVWTGQEHQIAAHMMYEGMVEKALAITRVVHERHHPTRRSPYNEVECSDHYARAMASYGTFLAACGFDYHGPKQHIAFAPRITPEDFRAPFVAAEGWGTYGQKATEGGQTHELRVRRGRLRLQTIDLAAIGDRVPRSARVRLNDVAVPALLAVEGGHLGVMMPEGVEIGAGATLTIELT
jgi:uncharacterized protein (DUF608 family)